MIKLVGFALLSILLTQFQCGKERQSPAFTNVKVKVIDYFNNEPINDATIGVFLDYYCLEKTYKTDEEGDIEFDFISKWDYGHGGYSIRTINAKTTNSQAFELVSGQINDITISTSIAIPLLDISIAPNIFDSIILISSVNSYYLGYYDNCDTSMYWNYNTDFASLDNGIENNITMKVAPNKTNEVFIKWTGQDTIRFDTLAVEIGTEILSLTIE